MCFVDYQRGDEAGHCRFKSAEGAAALLETLTSSPAELGGATPSWRYLSAEESAGYWEAYKSRKSDLAQRKRHKGGGRGGGKGRGYGGGRSRGRM